MVEKIRKRDGRIAPFEQEKITNAIFKAAQAVGGTDREIAKKLSDQVMVLINEKFNNKIIPTVENVQDIVEKVLVESGHYKTAKAYILYREEHKRLRDVKALLLNVGDVIDGYISEKEWRIKENANVRFSFSGLLWHGVGTIMAYYALNNVYPKEIADAHINGDYHLHNLSMSLCGYCAGWSLRQLLMEGLNGVSSNVHAGPAKHLRSAAGQMVNFIGTLQNEWAGAQAFSSFDTYLAPFVRYDKLSYDQVKQVIQEYVYGMNTTSRWGGQCVSEDTECLTNDGWKKHNEIDVDKDEIATFNIETGKTEFLKPSRVMAYDYDGELVRLKNRTQEQLVTPNHRVVRKRFNSKKFEFIEAQDLIKFKTPVLLPITSETESPKEIIDDWVRLYAWLVSEGTFSDDRGRISVFQSSKNTDNCAEIRKCFENLDFSWHEQSRIHGFSSIPSLRFRLNQMESEAVKEKISSKIIPEVIRTLSSRQIRMFVDTYVKGDGCIEKGGRTRIYTKNEKVKDQLQELCTLCGYGSTTKKNKAGVWAINLIRRPFASITKIDKVKYKGKVWCPTTKNGTFVARRNGKVFVTGNTPFSNITLDWTVPEDMKNDPVIIGGKLMDTTYADYQEEMDIVNKAFIEVMTTGDMKGRVFTWPIPTYNITKYLDWNNENLNSLFGMTAKYGLPYFQNFINSDLKPSDVRAMCLHGDEKIIFRDENGIKRAKISEFVNENSEENSEWSTPKKQIEVLSLNPHTYQMEWARIKNLLKTSGNILVKIKTTDGKTIKVSDNHPIAVYTKEGIRTKQAIDISNEDILITTRKAVDCLNKSLQKIDDLVLDNELARFLGLFLADGNYLYENRKNISTFGKTRGLQFTFNRNERNYIEFVRNFAKKRFNKMIKIRKDPRYANNVYCYLYDASISRKLSKYLNKKGRINNIFFNSHPIVISHFLKGFMEGDGYENGKEIHMNDEELAEDLCLLFTLIGIPVTFRKREGSQVIRIQHTLGRGSREGIIKNDILYNRVPQFVVITGKEKPFYNYDCLVSKSAIENHDAYTEECMKLLNGCFSVVRVESKEVEVLDKMIDFYDIELEKNNFFVHSLGNITHNCCRLQLNLKELRNKTGGLFGFGESTGSIGVVTINMPRIGYTSKDENEFLERLERLMYLAKNSLEIKRKLVNRMMDIGMLPFSKRYLGNFNHHFSTIGLIGMNEACQNFLHCGIETEEGRKFTLKVLDFMREKMVEFQEETGHIYNLEATPAEGTSYRMAKVDRAKYPNIITAGNGIPFYTNSTQLPVNYTDDVFWALKHQEDIQRKYTGGTVFHTFLGESPDNEEAVKLLVKKIASGFALPYFTITPTFSVCPSHGYVKGEHFNCPTCNAKSEVFSRVVGYIRPVQDWNEGKQAEFKDRLEFKVPS